MRIVAVAIAVALAACGVATTEPEVHQEAANGCPASTSTTWTPQSGVALTIEAATVGADCAQANAAITLRGAGGGTVWTETYPAAQVMTLAGADSVEDMQRRLGEWISPGGAMADSTGDLPEWTAGEDAPMSGEFPFYPDEGLDRAGYAALRARDAPLFCYVQGMESLACLAWENGDLAKVGLQTFPG
jgi:hypothetical protein